MVDSPYPIDNIHTCGYMYMYIHCKTVHMCILYMYCMCAEFTVVYFKGELYNVIMLESYEIHVPIYV